MTNREDQTSTSTPAYDPEWPIGFREFVILEPAVKDGIALGLTGDVRAQIAAMAKAGVPFTHPLGNWRWSGYVFRRAGHLITRMAAIPKGEEKGFWTKSKNQRAAYSARPNKPRQRRD